MVKTWFQRKVEHSYQYRSNVRISAQANIASTVKAVFLRLKQELKGFTVEPWTVSGSSDGSSAALDGVDRITDSTKLILSTGAHSWIVFYQATLGLYWCWDFSTNTSYRVTMVSSLVGFTGGSTTARPTATDERVVIDDDTWTMTAGGNNEDQLLNVWQAEDGLQTMVFVAAEGRTTTMIVLGRAIEPVPGWTTPVFVYGGCHSGSTTNADLLYKHPAIKSWGPSGALSFYASSFSGDASGALVTVAHDGVDAISGTYWTLPMALLSLTSGMKSRHGRLGDLWFCAPSVPNGFFPGTSDFAVFNNYVVPWGGSAPEYT
jgi:hypothetical protein